MAFHKLVYLLWHEGKFERGPLRDRLLGEVAPRLLKAGAAQLSMNIADPESRMRSPSPTLPSDSPICAQVSAWVQDPARHRELSAALAAAGFRIAGYRVEETVYTDYGENRHAGPRTWPDGQRSPGVVQVTQLRRPRRLTHDEWMRRWHGRMSPVSEGIQPRPRYVRNAVLEVLTPGAEALGGIVEEVWPSRRHVKNPFLYFGASNPWQLAVNFARVIGAVTSFLPLFRIPSTMMGEYFIRTDPRVTKVRRGAYDI
jgi:hypothetical protein